MSEASFARRKATGVPARAKPTAGEEGDVDAALPLQLGATQKSAERSGDRLVVVLAMAIEAPAPPRLSNETVEVKATFELVYRLQIDPEPEPASVDAFSRINTIYNAWPYFREFCASATSRLGFPPLTLPVMTAAEAVALSGLLPSTGGTQAELQGRTPSHKATPTARRGSAGRSKSA